MTSAIHGFSLPTDAATPAKTMGTSSGIGKPAPVSTSSTKMMP